MEGTGATAERSSWKPVTKVQSRVGAHHELFSVVCTLFFSFCNITTIKSIPRVLKCLRDSLPEIGIAGRAVEIFGYPPKGNKIKPKIKNLRWRSVVLFRPHGFYSP